ncbi:SPASM domain-containing protein [Enterococcus sp. LJL99]
MVVDKQNRGTKLLNDLGDSVFGIQVTMIPASPVGNSKMIPTQNLYLNNYDSFDLRCPSSCLEFVIHHDGFVYPCCSPSVFESNLIIGNIREEQIDSLEEKMFSNIALYILMKDGLGWFIEKLNIYEELSEQQFVSTCEICRYIFSKDNVFDLLYDEMLNYYEKEGSFV